MSAPVTTPGRLTTVLLNQFDFTSQLDTLTRESIVDTQDATTFGNTSHVRAPLNLDAKVDFDGFFDGSTSSSFNRITNSLIGTYAVLSCSRAGNALGAAADLISGLVVNNPADSKETGLVTTKLSIAASNPQGQTIDTPSMSFGKLILPTTVVSNTTLNTGSAVTFSPVDGTKTNTQVVVHAHLLAATGAVTVSLEYSPDGTTWTSLGTILSSSTPTAIRATFTTAIANTQFRVKYQGATQPYTLAVALALGASF